MKIVNDRTQPKEQWGMCGRTHVCFCLCVCSCIGFKFPFVCGVCVCACVYESISLTRLIESSITDAVSGLTNK